MKDDKLTGHKMAANRQKRHARPFWGDFDGKGCSDIFPNFFVTFFTQMKDY